jgi:hypothetical protein
MGVMDSFGQRQVIMFVIINGMEGKRLQSLSPVGIKCEYSRNKLPRETEALNRITRFAS